MYVYAYVYVCINFNIYLIFKTFLPFLGKTKPFSKILVQFKSHRSLTNLKTTNERDILL